jgi:hypothetical protein
MYIMMSWQPVNLTLVCGLMRSIWLLYVYLVFPICIFSWYFIFIYLLICSLFNNVYSNLDCMALNDQLLVKNELEGMGKKAAIVYWGTEENHRKSVRIVSVTLRFKLFTSAIQIKSIAAWVNFAWLGLCVPKFRQVVYHDGTSLPTSMQSWLMAWFTGETRHMLKWFLRCRRELYDWWWAVVTGNHVEIPSRK